MIDSKVFFIGSWSGVGGLGRVGFWFRLVIDSMLSKGDIWFLIKMVILIIKG